ncbi:MULTISPECIES: fla cluster protein FlaF [Haloferax]|uniref:Arl cluster protein ArlF n=2 Tax=Haloferax TaxID=2251 RepID=A0A0K1ISM5_HALGI|nr:MULTISPECIES: fla cluster protein FlaF [Haloferax]AKU07303.1 fla cluster protein FlaF [Haloferax gibbonsii]ELZ71649.1 fla cluster protein FlaF [Haloferax prahovense DSM 18310]QOS11383.1 arl cluster protein ArlF [Haloferax gibbonsii]RDZ46950.1 fla cluster protein FlaF [Haloferax sp. Atlit-16N]RDZ55168.1 fla cluster protein FlaF [Haloferax sp. Atlit-4N]
MGFGVSGSTAVIFLGVLVATGTLYTATSNASENVLEAQDADAERALERTNTDIAVTNATYDAGNESLTVNLTNAGSETLSVSETTLLVDNTYVDVPAANATVDGDAGTDLWYAGENLSLVVDADPTPARVKVVTGSGVAATGAVN